MLDILQNLDTALFLALNGLAPAWDAFFWWVSVPWAWTPLYLLLVLAVCRRFPARRSRLWVAMAVGLCLTGTDVVSARVLKPSVARLRPSHEPSLEEAIHLVEERPGKWYQGGSYGFVSSHAANHMGMALVFGTILGGPWLVGLLFWALLIGYSRIHLGVHYPGDVLGGFLVGWGMAGLALQLLARFNQHSTTS